MKERIDFRGDTEMTFRFLREDNKGNIEEIGKLWFDEDDVVFKFRGMANPTAQIFFDTVVDKLNHYLRTKGIMK